MPPKRSNAVVETLSALDDAFARIKVPWYVFGAQAAILYGVARATADIDVTVELGRHAPRVLVRALLDGGFAARVRLDDRFVAASRVLPVMHTHTGTPVDVVLGGPGLEELVLQRARRVVIGRRSFPVATVEDLIVLKLLAGRPQDLLDVAALLNRRGLDLDHVRGTLAEIEAALDEHDVLPRLETLLEQRKPRPTRRRRT